MQDFPEAARSYYALAAKTQADDANEKDLAGLTRILLAAPEPAGPITRWPIINIRWN